MLIVLLFIFGSFAHGAEPLPFFVPALVKKTSPLSVRTLSSFELEQIFHLQPEKAADQTLDSQMNLQLEKMKRLMPYRAVQFAQLWNELRPRLGKIQTTLIKPPGVEWNSWAHPKDEELLPVAVMTLTLDGGWRPYLSAELFPRLSEVEQAQVIWQLLWAYDFKNADNLKVRLVNNYLFSTFWNNLRGEKSFKLFKDLGFNYFEANGFCFKFNSNRSDFYPSGLLKEAWPSENCILTYQGQKIIPNNQIYFDENGNLERRLYAKALTTWDYQWEGQTFHFTDVVFYPDGSLDRGSVDIKSCANAHSQMVVKTSYAEFYIDCTWSLSFYENGIVSSIQRARALTMVQGRLIEVGNKPEDKDPRLASGVGFHRNAALRFGYLPEGTQLKTFKKRNVVLKRGNMIWFDDKGLATEGF